MLPQTAEYALRAMAWIALHEEDGSIRSRDLAEAVDIPQHYLSKIMRRLVVAELVVSRRGHGGGFVLARAPETISFCEILEAVDAAPESGSCAFGWGACDASNPCPLHLKWSEMQRSMRAWAMGATLADIQGIRDY